MKCEQLLETLCGGRALMTPSCTSALELSVWLLAARHGSEVIVPSFTFPSTANAVIRAGLIPVFVDVELETLNISPDWAWGAVTNETAAIMPVWYAGVSPDMERINGIAGLRHLKVIEDAAQAIGSFRLTGDFGCISFHDTKNIGVGEGGALIVREKYAARAAQLANCGTDYPLPGWDWRDVGTHALMSPILKEKLWEKLKNVEAVTAERLRIWEVYRAGIRAKIKASRPGNGHIFWFLHEHRAELQNALRYHGITLKSHHTALHATEPGRKYGRTYGEPVNAALAADQICRPPMDVTDEEALRIIELVNFYSDNLRDE